VGRKHDDAKPVLFAKRRKPEDDRGKQYTDKLKAGEAKLKEERGIIKGERRGVGKKIKVEQEKIDKHFVRGGINKSLPAEGECGQTRIYGQ